MVLNFQRTRDLLYEFHFKDLFIEELGWLQPSLKKASTLEIKSQSYSYQSIAQASGVFVFEITFEDGEIPEAKVRGLTYTSSVPSQSFLKPLK